MEKQSPGGLSNGAGEDRREELHDELHDNLLDDIDLDVRILDAQHKNYRTGYPDILNHPQHYKKWHAPSQAQLQIVCHQTVLNKIQQHANSYATQEIGGILVGHYYVYDGSNYLEISEYLPAPREGAGQNSASHFTFTETIWAEMLREKDRDLALEQLDIVGWFHSHPNWGTQPSSLDIDIQQEHFSFAWQVALIYDPYRHEGDFYLWHNHQLVTAPGFYEVFSRVRPKAITNWRNYLAPRQPQHIPMMDDDVDDDLDNGVDSEVSQDHGSDQPADQNQAGGDDDVSQPGAADRPLASHGPADERAAARNRARGNSVSASTVPAGSNQEQISITSDDIFWSFLRRHWVELLLSGLIAIMIPLILYLMYGYFTAPIAQDDSREQVQSGQISANGPGMFDPTLLDPADSAANESRPALQMAIDEQSLNSAPQLSIISRGNRALICASDPVVGEALLGSNTLLLIMKPQMGNKASVIYSAPTSGTGSNDTVCFEQPVHRLHSGNWDGAIYMVRATEGDAVDAESAPLSFSPFGPPFIISIDDARGSNER